MTAAAPSPEDIARMDRLMVEVEARNQASRQATFPPGTPRLPLAPLPRT